MQKFLISKSSKPLFRGYIHQEAFFIFLGACIILVSKSTNLSSLLGSLVYSIGLLMLFGISAIYHRPHWNGHFRAWMRKLDHAAIYFFIAATSTPICLLALSQHDSTFFLCLIWAIAIVGVVQSFFWVNAPKVLVAIFYLSMGWLALPYLYDFKKFLGTNKVLLIVLGGLAYSIGAICYALKKPVLNPKYFGYHEIFHVLTVVGVCLHFIVIYQIIN